MAYLFHPIHWMRQFPKCLWSSHGSGKFLRGLSSSFERHSAAVRICHPRMDAQAPAGYRLSLAHWFCWDFYCLNRDKSILHRVAYCAPNDIPMEKANTKERSITVHEGPAFPDLTHLIADSGIAFLAFTSLKRTCALATRSSVNWITAHQYEYQKLQSASARWHWMKKMH